MFNWIVKKLFKERRRVPKGAIITVEINDKIKPIDRGDVYEDPMDDFLKAKKLGELCGGGTILEKNGEISFCDLQFQLFSDNPGKELIEIIINKLESLGAPKGSKLINEKDGKKIVFGKLEGLGLYLDGINLSDEVYSTADPFYVVSEVKKLASIASDVIREWTGETETGFYFYGDSFQEINEAIKSFIESYPLCKDARIVRVA